MKLSEEELFYYEKCFKEIEGNEGENGMKPKKVANFLKRSKVKNVSVWFLVDLLECSEKAMEYSSSEEGKKSQKEPSFPFIPCSLSLSKRHQIKGGNKQIS